MKTVIKAWGIAHPKYGPLVCGDGTPMVFPTREEASRDADPDEGQRPVRVTVCYPKLKAPKRRA